VIVNRHSRDYVIQSPEVVQSATLFAPCIDLLGLGLWVGIGLQFRVRVRIRLWLGLTYGL
jgi:hypothetical protein